LVGNLFGAEGIGSSSGCLAKGSITVKVVYIMDPENWTGG